MPIDQVRVSSTARDQLTTLKRRTSVEHWNTLCRWALCRSLAEEHSPPDAKIVTDSNVQMDWSTFTGEHGPVYWALLRQRCHDDGLPLTDESLAHQFRLHLHRGLGYLAGDQNLRNIEDLLTLALIPASRE